VTETDSSGATTIAYQVDSGSPSGSAPQVGITSEETTTVTVTNVFVTVAPTLHGKLHITKAVNRKIARYGQDLTYTLHVRATGQINQHDVTVTDVVPAHTTFVSAGCPTPCSVSGPNGGGVVTWNVGDLDTGAAITLTMVVNITTPADTTAQRQPETIRNIAVAGSTDDPLVASNKVHTQVTAVQGEQITRHKPTSSGSTLPFTGFDAERFGLVALMLIGIGGAMQIAARRSRG
jgi:uncharacterized repeat protein (TIGR01451 family)